MTTTPELDRLLKIISQLNASAGEIGPGMLVQICSLVESAYDDLHKLKSEVERLSGD